MLAREGALPVARRRQSDQHLTARERRALASGHMGHKIRFYGHVAVDALKWVLPLMIAEGVLSYFHLPSVELNALVTSIISGSIFVLGFILAGVLADYKEAERIPAEMASSIESLLEDGKYASLSVEGFDLPHYAASVANLARAIDHDLHTRERALVEASSALTPWLVSMETLGVPANHVVRIKGEISSIRTRMLRIYHMQCTSFLPSVYLYVQTLVFLVVALLLWIKIEPWYAAVVQTGVVSYLLIYLLKLIRHLDTPFRVNELTNDDVSLFLLREVRDRADAIAEDHSGSGVVA